MINVLADRYLFDIETYLPDTINFSLFDPARGLPPEIDAAHGLLIRTVLPINKQTLPKIPKQLTFVGTGSAGRDHVDIDYLRSHGISFADAGGCNARSVAEYVATSLLLWAENKHTDLSKLSLGVIGAGNVGRQVINMGQKLGIPAVAYDPPREKREAGFKSSSQEQVLDCDILSFHTPLETDAPCPTYHWLDAAKLSNRTYRLLINTARGGVIDEEDVLKACREEQVQDLIIDVWENEPMFNLDTAEQAFIKTPHVAGYSVQAKANASKLVTDALLDHFDLPKPLLQNGSGQRFLKKDITAFPSLSSLLAELHPLRAYEQKLNEIMEHHPQERGIRFNKLRAEFPLRQEFAQTYLPTSYFKRYPVLKKLGFSLLSDIE